MTQPNTTSSSSSPSTTTTTSTSVILVAIGGPTCSGKTTLAKHLDRIIPTSRLVFQDDFAPSSDQIPIHPEWKFQDWDDPEGAIDWERQRRAIKFVKSSKDGNLPVEHYSHDHLNEQVPVPIDPELQRAWTDKFNKLIEARRAQGIETTVVIMEGFLMLYDLESIKQFDVKFFVREDYDTLKRRRHERHGYHTTEGALWRDPPDYWDKCVWPAYLKAHQPLFVNRDHERGEIDPTRIGGGPIEILEARELSMDQMVERSLEGIYKQLCTALTIE
ncbi:ribosylnicotinamide kinase [Sporobolomyces koalae]|uniref:ribosylnicotinamide kinase n=1 Tax=Sporobolomyces koalae TaxID=500713 RepID=UPI00316D75D6